MEHRLVVIAFSCAAYVINCTSIPLTDGMTLAARIWLPENAERSPVLAMLGTHTGIHRCGEPQDIAEPVAFLILLPRRMTATQPRIDDDEVNSI